MPGTDPAWVRDIPAEAEAEMDAEMDAEMEAEMGGDARRLQVCSHMRRLPYEAAAM
jgi:hypothetical protein